MGQYDAYTKSQANTVSKIGLIVMLYEGAIRFLSLSIHNINEKKFYEKAKNINKASKIIEELQGSLDFEQGGDIAENLNKLYSFFLKEIGSAGINNNKEAILKVIELLNDMKNSWAQVEKEQNQVLHQQNSQLTTGQPLRISG